MDVCLHTYLIDFSSSVLHLARTSPVDWHIGVHESSSMLVLFALPSFVLAGHTEISWLICLAV